VVFTSDGRRKKEIDTRIGRPVTKGRAGGRTPLGKFFDPLENVLNIVQKFEPLSENSSPLVSQAGYGSADW